VASLGEDADPEAHELGLGIKFYEFAQDITQKELPSFKETNATPY
jgi:hypothetical protein